MAHIAGEVLIAAPVDEEYDRPHRLHNVVRSSYLQVEGTVTFHEVDGGTRLRWDWDMGWWAGQGGRGVHAAAVSSHTATAL